MSLKTPVLGINRRRVSLPSIYLLKVAKNVLDAKKTIVFIFALLKSFSV